ncbi:MAG: hypothetical protein WC279_13305 [Sulfurimonas sp.]|jgi:hypothetical protein|uniref:hypothetical protein n=1 Tax=Sulfurimonas sp. TaxID=2022749 RepID=UPI00356644C8
MANIKRIDKLRLFDMIKYPELYSGLADGLIDLPLPDKLKIKKILTIPLNREQLAENICYGQRLYLAREELNDFGIIIRLVGGYFYPEITGLKFNEANIFGIVKNIVTCLAKDIYPVALHLVKLISELIANEQKVLYKEPTKLELAAGIEKLNAYSELNTLDFLSNVMRCTPEEVMLTPYNECLVRLMNAKEMNEYQERYFKLQMEESQLKTKKR